MVLYRIASFIFKIYFILFHKVSIKGAENIPKTGGLVVCANHIHWMDPVLLGSFLGRSLHFMAKAELFKNSISAVVLKGINVFPVKRGTPDISAIKTSFKLIKEGKVLGIFPEGTRSRDGRIKQAEPGVALIAVKTKAPVIPIRIKGEYRLFGKIDIIVGKAISFDSYSEKKLTGDEINELSQSIMEEISILV